MIGSRRILTLLAVGLSTAALFSLTACEEMPTAAERSAAPLHSDAELENVKGGRGQKPHPHSSIAIKPEALSLAAPGDTATLAATVTDKHGQVQQGMDISWTALNPEIVDVNASGTVTAVALGLGLITASCDGDVDTAAVSVGTTIIDLSVSPAYINLSEGEPVQLDVEATDVTGLTVSPVDVAWTSSQPSVASVDATGLVTTYSAGMATITAAADGVEASAVIDVEEPLSGPATGSAARRADAFVNSVGVNVHLGYLDRVYGSEFYTIIKPKLEELGIRHLRDKAVVVTSDGWMEKIYGRMNELAAAGMAFTLINLPAQSVSDYSNAAHLDRLFQYLTPSAVAGMEGLNEHDFSGHSEWAAEVRAFQKALYRRVAEDSRLTGVPVLGPSMGRPKHAADVGDLSAYMQYGVMHPYPGGQIPAYNLGYHERYLQPMSGTRPLVATESGYHTAPAYTGTHPGVSETAMGRYVPRMFLEYFRRGIPRTFSYELIDQGTDPADKERHFGLLRLDGSEKPAFSALRNLLTLLSDPGPTFEPSALSYTLEGDTTDIQRVLLQKRDGRFYLVLWQATSSYDVDARTDLNVEPRALTLSLGTPAAAMQTYLPLEAAEPTGRWNDVGRISVSVPDHPLVVEISP